MPAAAKQSVSFERAAGSGPVSKGGTSWSFEENSKSCLDMLRLICCYVVSSRLHSGKE